MYKILFTFITNALVRSYNILFREITVHMNMNIKVFDMECSAHAIIDASNAKFEE